MVFHIALFASATHIVGGEMYYELVNPSNNTYRITLKVYMDCENGTPQAISGDFAAMIGVFDGGHHAFKSYFTMTRTGPIRMDKSNYNCVVPPTGVCVDEYTYTQLKTIDPGTNGVILAFTRCCRNRTISNILAPENAGIVIWTKIPPKTTLNSSAVFNSQLPNYVCVNAPLNIDLEATDIDGDSLVYKLHTPFTGGDRNDPRPTPSNLTRPPFTKIMWRGVYHEGYQMAGSPALSINSSTGELTITPTATGQFTVGITVQEYRNGQLIGESMRDYQMNVINCEFDILADYTVEGGTAVDGAYSFECRDTVHFLNQSQSRTTPSYRWNFGDPTTEADTSHEANPYWVYPGNGNYRVTLTVTSSICSDEYVYEVRIRSVKPFELGPDVILCDTIDHLIDPRTPDAVSMLWNTGATSKTLRARDTGRYSVEVSYGNCSYADTIHIGNDPVPELMLPRDSLFCEAIDIVLDPGVPNLSYEWNTNPKNYNQTLHVTEPGTYILTARNLHCTTKDTTRLWIASKAYIEDTLYCEEFNHAVDIGNFEEGEYLWSNGSTQPATTYTTRGIHWVQLKQRHCVHTDSFSIQRPVIRLDLGEDLHFCDQVSHSLDGGPDGLEYQWNTGEASRSIAIDTEGLYSVVVIDKHGCSKEDSVNITRTFSPVISLGNDTTLCINTPITVGPSEEYAAYIWSTEETTQKITLSEEGTYYLKVIDQFGCTGSDTLSIVVDPEALPNDLYVPNAFTPDGDLLNDRFPYPEEVEQPEYFVWVYNRWGEKIFDSQAQPTGNWDGMYKGKPVHEGAYIYYMQYRGCDGFSRTRKGTVTIIYPGGSPIN